MADFKKCQLTASFAGRHKGSCWVLLPS